MHHWNAVSSAKKSKIFWEGRPSLDPGEPPLQTATPRGHDQSLTFRTADTPKMTNMATGIMRICGLNV